MGSFLHMKSIRKSFDGNEVLHGVDFTCEKGEIHVLMGENGAGKSTLLKILTGVYQPNGGEILLDGKSVVYQNTYMAQEIGIAMVYQELTMLPHMTVADNIFLNNHPLKKGKFIDAKKVNQYTQDLIDEYDLQISPDDLIGDIPLAKRQMVEIMKLMIKEPQVIILDEPTSSLNRAEVAKLFDIVRRFKKQNKTVIFISHRLEEVFELGDRITVLKDGSLVGTLNIADTNEEELIKMMVGRELNMIFPHKDEEENEDVVMEVRGLNVTQRVHDIDFSVRRGEVIGIAGLQGHGQSELLSALAGVTPRESGDIILNGTKIKMRSPIDAIRAHIAYVTDDRKNTGLCLKLSVAFNLALTSLFLRQKMTFIKRKLEKMFIKNSIDQLDIRVFNQNQPVQSLSGGNQQKVVLGKVLALEPKILLVDEPTRGIDVNTKHEIYKLMRRLASSGVVVIMFSSDLLEVMGMSDKVLVMYEGRIMSELTGNDINEETIMRYAVGFGKAGEIAN